MFDLGRRVSEVHPSEPVVWEFTSAVVQGILILVILRFDRRFPIRLKATI